MAALCAYKDAVNSRSYEALRRLLAADVRTDGLPDEFSRASLAAGSRWLPANVTEIRIFSLVGRPDGVDARTALCMGSGYLPLKIGFDRDCKIRSIDAIETEKPREAKTSGPFTCTFTVSGGLPFVRATVDGRSGFFLFDTGSSNLLLNQKYFAPGTAAAAPGLSATVNGIAPSRGTRTVRLLVWGRMESALFVGQLHDFSRMERPEITPLLGAISHREIRNSSILFDWKSQTLRIFPTRPDGSRQPLPGEQAPSAVFPFTYFLHMPMVKARIGTKDYDMLFDSGAQLNLLPNITGMEPHFQQSGFLGGFSSGGAPGAAARVPVGTVDRFTLRQTEYLDLPFAVYQIPYLPGKGMLGTPLLRQGRVEINFRLRQFSVWR